jgi:hypothetical protein
MVRARAPCPGRPRGWTRLGPGWTATPPDAQPSRTHPRRSPGTVSRSNTPLSTLLVQEVVEAGRCQLPQPKVTDPGQYVTIEPVAIQTHGAWRSPTHGHQLVEMGDPLPREVAKRGSRRVRRHRRRGETLPQHVQSLTPSGGPRRSRGLDTPPTPVIVPVVQRCSDLVSPVLIGDVTRLADLQPVPGHQATAQPSRLSTQAFTSSAR